LAFAGLGATGTVAACNGTADTRAFDRASAAAISGGRIGAAGDHGANAGADSASATTSASAPAAISGSDHEQRAGRVIGR
jgi:hypothetical protein